MDSENNTNLNKNFDSEIKKKPKHPFWDLIKEIIYFAILCVILAGILFGVFYLTIEYDAIFDNLSNIFYLMFYPCLLGAFCIWIKLFKKRKFKDFMLGLPKMPKRGERWFYVLIILGYSIVMVTYVVLFAAGLAVFVIPIDFWLLFFHGVVGAPIVEEIIFRGYIYLRCESIYNQNGYYISWTRKKFDDEGLLTEFPFMTFQVTYAAIVSSLLFGIFHMNLLQLLYTPIAGLIICKFRREWKSLIPCMIFHAMVNSFSHIYSVIFIDNISLWGPIYDIVQNPLIFLIPIEAIIALLVILPFLFSKFISDYKRYRTPI